MKKLTFLMSLAAILFSVSSCDLLEALNNNTNGGNEPGNGPDPVYPAIAIKGLDDVSASTAVLALECFYNDIQPEQQPVFRCGCVSADIFAGLSGKTAEFLIGVLAANGIEAQTDFSKLPDGTATFEGLRSGTAYKAAAVVEIDGKPYYSDLFEFTTAEGPGEIALTQEVDLGLSVLWAGWNIGTENPAGYGTYFCWGETTAWAIGYSGASKYKFYDSASPSSRANFKKYVTSSTYATDQQYVDGLTTLLAEDDAATANWGDGWRMPTDAEKTELLANTTHLKYEFMGVQGFVFTSKINGAAIFIPSAGIKMYGSSVTELGSLCGFWTSTLRSSDNQLAYIACNKTNSNLMPEAGFEMDPTAESWHLSQYRWYGLPVRAVKKK